MYISRSLCPKFRLPPSRRLFTTTCICRADNNLDNKAFSKTLLLPKTSFPLWADTAKNEERFQKLTCDNLYRWQWENAKGPLFVFLDGPPYANGNLHIGHALNKILKDIINRFHVSLGHKVHYHPGWDCHGLPIENKALQELGKDALSVPRGTIRDAARATALREVESQKAQFRPFGVMADWDSKDRTYRTLDHNYEMRQLKIFQKMVEHGMIYRHYRPVHYSPSSHSALAEAELEYKEDHVSHSVYVTFDLDKSVSGKNAALQELVLKHPVQILVWTTTPWTLTANMGIAVNEELSYLVVRRTNEEGTEQPLLVIAKERLEALKEVIGEADAVLELPGTDLVNLSYHPIFSSLTPSAPMRILPSSHVTSESGTGLVHCAPAHGAEDYNVFRSLGLISTSHNMVCHVNDLGKFSREVHTILGDAGARVVGKDVLGEGSKAIVDILREGGRLVKIKRIKHKYPYDWKTKEPIIVTATSQWFANLDKIKDKALNALQDVAFYPSGSRNRLESFIRIRSEWCISRQRVWGVPIPALHHLPTDRTILNTESLNHILSVLEAKGTEHWWHGPVEDFIPPSLLIEGENASETWKKGTDTMDVWFDSGTSWSQLPELGVGSERGMEGGRRFHADVCLEGTDQHRGWFQSQLLTAIGAEALDTEPASPYSTLITHGMVLDEKGKKMSKSLGNIVSPLTVVYGGENKKKDPVYGSDVLRLWVATVEYWRDMSIGPKVLSQTAEAMRKIRNSARFCLGNMGNTEPVEKVPRSEMGLAERYIMHELYTLEKTALEGYATYNFPKVMSALGNFANVTLSSIYFDITKDCLYAASPSSLERRTIVTVLEKILETMTRVLAPVMPHLAEEIHASWKADGKSIFMTEWVPLSSEWEDNQAYQDMRELLRVRSSVLSLLEQARGLKQIKSSLEAEVDIILEEDGLLSNLLRREENFLKTLFIVSDVAVIDEGSLGVSSPDWAHSDTLSINEREENIAIRVRPATLHKCSRCWTYTREENDRLCQRCEDVIGTSS